MACCWRLAILFLRVVLLPYVQMNKFKVLIIEDSPDLAEFMCHLLTLKNYNVQTSISHEGIISQLDEFMPDIILMDVHLKGEDGRELCSKLKQIQRFRHIPNILMSANPGFLTDFTAWSADDVLHKPFEIVTLVDTITRHTGR